MSTETPPTPSSSPPILGLVPGIIKELGLPTALLLLLLYWGQTAGSFLAPIALDVSKAILMIAQTTTETNAVLQRRAAESQKEHAEILAVERDVLAELRVIKRL